MSHDPLGRHPRLVAVIGWPIAHSLSPAMHQPALAAAGINALYVALAVAPDQVGPAVAGLRALGFLGANVTIPHKQAVLPYLDEVADDARLVGAVNTIAVRDGRLLGYNTDVAGFLSHLQEEGVAVAGARAVVLGAGGAARAVAVALARAGAQAVAVLNRTRERAEAVAALAREAAALDGRRIAVGAAAPADLEARPWLAAADLVVNCTPLGMAPATGETPLPPDLLRLLPGGCTVYDTVYRPATTRLLQEARDRGLRAVGGLGMLVHQGAESWRYWFGRPGPVAAMAQAVRAALGESDG